MLDEVDFDAYRRYMTRRYCQATVWARLANARRWVDWCDDWRTATVHDVEDWIAERAVSAAATRNLLGHVRAFYRWAIRHDLTQFDPTRQFDPIRLPRRLPRPAPDHLIADVIDSADAQLRAMVALMSGAGLRCCEVSRLNWRDIDLVGGRIIVAGKGGRERVLDVGPDVRRALGALDGDTGPVFTGVRGGRLSPARVSQIVAQAFTLVGADHVTAHQLRHRFATVALEQDTANLLMVRDALGHANVITTQIYTAISADRTAAMVRAIRVPGTR